MKKLKKTIATVFVFGILCCTLSVNAEKIVDEERMRDKIESNILPPDFELTQPSDPGKKSMSPERKRAILTLCDRRIALLNAILTRGGIERTEVISVIGSYLGTAGIEHDSYEAKQLYRSGTPKDLRYNIEVLISLYGKVRDKYAAAVTVREAPTDTHVCRRGSDRREGRKGYRQGGRLGRR